MLRAIFSFEGRASPRSYLLVFVPTASWSLFFPIYDLSTRGPGGPMTWLTFFAACAWFLSLYVAGAALARRVHDTGRSGRFLLVLPVMFGALDAVGQRMSLELKNSIFLVVMALIAVAGLVLAGVASDPEANEFGLADASRPEP